MYEFSVETEAVSENSSSFVLKINGSIKLVFRTEVVKNI